MNASSTTFETTPCGPLPDLEVPMINTVVTCLGGEHRRFNYLLMQLALAATRLADHPDSAEALQHASEIWDEIRSDLWSHLQIEDELITSWGEGHHAISDVMLVHLKNERDEMRRLMAAMPAPRSQTTPEPRNVNHSAQFADALLGLARTLDSHVERYDGEVLPSILRALYHH